MYAYVYIYIYIYPRGLLGCIGPKVTLDTCELHGLATDHIRDGMGYMACASLRVQWPFRAVLRALARAFGPSGPILHAIRRLWIALCSDLYLSKAFKTCVSYLGISDWGSLAF